MHADLYKKRYLMGNIHNSSEYTPSIAVFMFGGGGKVKQNKHVDLVYLVLFGRHDFRLFLFC